MLTELISLCIKHYVNLTPGDTLPVVHVSFPPTGYTLPIFFLVYDSAVALQ